MKIYAIEDIGQIIRSRRIELGLKQSQLADLSGSGIRFISELENGKPTMQVGKVLDTMLVLGLDMSVSIRGSKL